MIGIVRFGAQDKIRFVQDVPLKGKDGEPLFLGHRITTGWLFLPLIVGSEGYVLGIRGRSGYYPLPPPDVARYQQAGYLPNPLPKAQLRATDYLPVAFGWLVIVAGLAAKLLS
jgi:hypothetical protein